MNMPRPEFVRGMSPGTYSLHGAEAFVGKIFIFEADRRYEPERDLAYLIKRWTRKHKILGLGYVHSVIFPEQLGVDMLAWTIFQAFHLLQPNDRSLAPSNLVLFTSSRELLRGKRQIWQEKGYDPNNKGFIVHANCYEPTGELFKQYRLLTF